MCIRDSLRRGLEELAFRAEYRREREGRLRRRLASGIEGNSEIRQFKMFEDFEELATKLGGWIWKVKIPSQHDDKQIVALVNFRNGLFPEEATLDKLFESLAEQAYPWEIEIDNRKFHCSYDAKTGKLSTKKRWNIGACTPEEL